MSDVAMFKVLSARKSVMGGETIAGLLRRSTRDRRNEERLFGQGLDESNLIFGDGTVVTTQRVSSSQRIVLSKYKTFLNRGRSVSCSICKADSARELSSTNVRANLYTKV
jgi:hypothetical protein